MKYDSLSQEGNHRYFYYQIFLMIDNIHDVFFRIHAYRHSLHVSIPLYPHGEDIMLKLNKG